MDLNSRINWLPGMEITAQTFIGLEEKLDFQQQIAIRAALGSTQMGMLPGTELSCKGVFVKNTFEVENLRCMALLPSGKIIDADEKAVVPIPMLFGDSYYLTIGISDTTTSFEKEGVPYLRPHYEYALLSLEEAESQDVMPLVHFNVKDGMFSIDTGYIPPCLLMTGNQQFVTCVEKYVSKLSTITSHQNLEEGDGKRALLHYLFIMKGYSQRNSVHDFLMLLQEIAHAVDYYIISPNTEQPIVIPQPRQVDVMKWLNWFEDYLTGAVAVLDKVVLVGEAHRPGEGRDAECAGAADSDAHQLYQQPDETDADGGTPYGDEPFSESDGGRLEGSSLRASLPRALRAPVQCTLCA